MSTDRPSPVAPVCLVLGALLGLGGSFAPSASLRGIAWGLDGTFLVVAASLLAVHCLRRNLELAAAGFLVFMAGQTLVVSGSAMSLEASSPLFAAGGGPAREPRDASAITVARQVGACTCESRRVLA